MTEQFTIRDFTRNHGQYIAGFAAQSREVSGQLDVTPIFETESHLSFRLEFPTHPVVVDAWNPHHPKGKQAFSRELTCHTLIKGSGLAAQMLGHSAQKHLLITESIKGAPLNTALTQRNITNISRSLGNWLHQFHLKMPQKDVDTTWFNYLKNYPDLFKSEEYEREKAFLQSLKIETLAIAKNDRIHGLVLTETNSICAANFQHASYKPVGWDLLLAVRDLIEKFPGQTDPIIAELLLGWGELPGLAPADFMRLAKLFTVATVFRKFSPAAPLLSRYAQAFNASRDPSQKKVTTVLSVPFKTNRQEDIPPKTLKNCANICRRPRATPSCLLKN